MYAHVAQRSRKRALANPDPLAKIISVFAFLTFFKVRDLHLEVSANIFPPINSFSSQMFHLTGLSRLVVESALSDDFQELVIFLSL